MIITPFAYMAEQVSGPVVPTSGLIGWYDAADYTSGATWIDKSVNGLDLTLSGTYSLDSSTLGGPSLFFNTAYGQTAETSLISTSTEYTVIQILRPTNISIDRSSYAFGVLSSYIFGGSGRIMTWRNGLGGIFASSQTYNTTDTWFVSRRFARNYTTTSNIIFDIANSNTLSLTKYTGGSNALGSGTYTWADFTGTQRKFAVGSLLGGSFGMAGRYAVNLLYDRQLTDQEVTDIYNYYKTTYSLA